MTARAPAVLAVLALATLALPAAAQDRSRFRQFDLEFDGGPVSRYVAAIRDRVEDANIILMEGAGSVPVPRMALRSVTLPTALAILGDLEEDRGDRRVRLRVVEHEPKRMPVGPGQPGTAQVIGNAVYTIQAQAARSSGFGSVPDESRVVTVGDLLEDLPPAAVLTAVETALELLGDDLPPARIRFHEETGLLIARGHPEQMAAIEEVVEQARLAAAQRAGHARRETDADRREGRIAELEAALAELQVRNEAVRQEMLGERMRAEAMAREHEDCRHRLAATRDDLERSADHRRELEAELAACRRRLGGGSGGAGGGGRE